MALVVLGRKTYNFTDSKSGQQVQGVKIHCREQYSTPDNGYLTETIGAKIQYPLYQALMSVPFGAVITPVYNKYGSATDIIIVSESEEKPPAETKK